MTDIDEMYSTAYRMAYQDLQFIGREIESFSGEGWIETRYRPLDEILSSCMH